MAYSRNYLSPICWATPRHESRDELPKLQLCGAKRERLIELTWVRVCVEIRKGDK